MVRALSITVLLLLVGLPLLAALPALQWPSAMTLAPWLNALMQTLLVTLLSTLVVTWLSLSAARTLATSRWFSALSVLLATPHVAFAVGVMFLFSPSGYLVRVIDALTGWLPVPANGWPLPEKSLLTLTVVLVLKELPFLLLMIATELKQLPLQRWLLQAQSLGWSATRAWWWLIVPELLQRLKLPLAAIIIYTVSVVDIPLLLGPNAPGLLAVVAFEQHYQWANTEAAAIGVWLLILAGAVLLLAATVTVNGYQRLAERARQGLVKTTASRWRRLQAGGGRLITPTLVIVSLLVVLALLLHSLAGSWFYPALLPQQWQPQRWLTEWPYLAPLLWDTFWLALLTGLLSVAAAVAVLEHQRQRGQRQLNVVPLLLLLLPQLVLVLGWQRLLGQGSEGPLLLWAHVAFGFPFAYLILHGAWVNLSQRWLYQAQSLGYSYRRAWFTLVPGMMRGPLLTAFAIAFSVSIAQYLPTLWLAGGTVPTLTTEAVSIASGGDWRLASLYALMQALLPLLVLSLVMFMQTRQRGTDVSY